MKITVVFIGIFIVVCLTAWAASPKFDQNPLPASTLKEDKTKSFSLSTGGFALPMKQQRASLNIVHADKGIYQEVDGVVHATGNVILVYGTDTMIADEVWYTPQERKFRAQGNVSYYYRVFGEDKNRIMRCSGLEYDMDSDQGEVYQARTYLPPMFVKAPVAKQLTPQYQVVAEGIYTTCNKDEPHYYFKARSVEIYPGDKLIARNVTMYVGKYPVMYFPYYSRSLKDEEAGFFYELGRNSRAGTYVRTGYRFPINEHIRTLLRVDYYSQQGWGFGNDVKYDYGSTGRGYLQTFWIDESEYQTNRWRVSFKHRTELKNNYTMSAFVDYPSDQYLDEHYIRLGRFDERGKKYDRESYLMLNKWDSNYSLRVITRRMDVWVDDTTQRDLGDYKNSETSLPKLEGTLKYQQLGELPLYYKTSGFLADNRRYSGDYPSIRQTTYNSVDANWSQTISYPFSITDQMVMLSSFSWNNDYSSKTSDDENTDTFDSYLQAQFRLHNNWTARLKTDLFYTAIQQLNNDEDETDSSSVEQYLGGKLSYRVPNSRLRIRWRGDVSLQSEDRIPVNTRQYYSRLDANWKLNQQWSTGLTNILVRGKRTTSSSVKYFQEYQSYQGYVKYQHNDRWYLQLNLYCKENQRPKARGGDYEESYINPVYSTYLGKKWKIEAAATYNTKEGQFDEEKVLLIRDLHCWESYLRLRHTPTDDSVHFVIKLKAMTTPVFAVDDRNPLNMFLSLFYGEKLVSKLRF
jgi:lipopolysaccharide assembly outer membrane protein LptD (OstA)